MFCNQHLYLTADEYPVFDQLRRCEPLRFLRSDGRDDLLLVRCEPAWDLSVMPDPPAEAGCENFLILASRFTDYSLRDDLNLRPATPVYVGLPRRAPSRLGVQISPDDYFFYVWGEVYGPDRQPNRSKV